MTQIPDDWVELDCLFNHNDDLIEFLKKLQGVEIDENYMRRDADGDFWVSPDVDDARFHVSNFLAEGHESEIDYCVRWVRKRKTVDGSDTGGTPDKKRALRLVKEGAEGTK